MAVLTQLRRAAVAIIKPRVSERSWELLCRLDPSAERRAQRARRKAKALAKPSDNSQPSLSERDLPSLAKHFGTDKWGVHRYAQHYERHLEHLKNEEFTLLEIGIGGYRREKAGGASLRMWKAFFPRAQIVGLDIYDKSFVNEPRIRAYRGSQTDAAMLRTIVSDVDRLLVVIDDGSHRSEDIKETFSVLFPLLEDGGIYAIEDLQTSYFPRWGGTMDLADPNTSMGLIKQLLDGLNFEEWQSDDYQPSYSDQHVVAIHAYHNLVVLEKGTNNEGTNRKPQWYQPVR